MKKLVGVLTEDEYLFEKIMLAALEYAEVVRINATDATEEFDCIIADIDTHAAPSGAIRVSRQADCELSIPFSFDSLKAAISGGSVGSALRVGKDTRTAYFRGQKIPLTEVEHALLSVLFEAKDFVSREELLSRVWGGEANPGVINVYVHYLREKLEGDGEKVIISSRKQGYRIAEKFLTEDKIC